MSTKKPKHYIFNLNYIGRLRSPIKARKKNPLNRAKIKKKYRKKRSDARKHLKAGKVCTKLISFPYRVSDIELHMKRIRYLQRMPTRINYMVNNRPCNAW